MSKKTSEARKRAFFAALADTGNQTISAERACVSRSWVSLHRSTDPAFKARMEACIAKAAKRLSGVGAMKPDAKWGNIHGEELVVRGSNGRRAQLSRARVKQFRRGGKLVGNARPAATEEQACAAISRQLRKIAIESGKRVPKIKRQWKGRGGAGSNRQP
jgi:hypothetical protein